MKFSYFELVDDVEASGRWFLKSPRDKDGAPVDARMFTVARPMIVQGPLAISLRREGARLDWTFADFDMPVASASATRVLQQLAPQHVEIHPACVEKQDEEFAVINVLACRKCVDESESEFLKWTPTDNRPDKCGDYRQMTRLRIRAAAAEDADIFRVDGWRIALIVSERIKKAFEAERFTGVRFLSVS